MDLTRSAADALSSDSPHPTSRKIRSFSGYVKCTRVLRRVSAGTLRCDAASSRARQLLHALLPRQSTVAIDVERRPLAHAAGGLAGDLRVECFSPLDDATAAAARTLLDRPYQPEHQLGKDFETGSLA